MDEVGKASPAYPQKQGAVSGRAQGRRGARFAVAKAGVDVAQPMADQVEQPSEAQTAGPSQQAALAELGRYAVMETDLGALLAWAAVLVARALRVERSAILQLLPDGGAFVLSAAAGWEAGRVGQLRVDAHEPSVALLFAGETVVVEDAARDGCQGRIPLLDGQTVVSGVGTRIQGGHGVLGILGVYAAMPRAFTQDEVPFLVAVANVLAMVMERERTAAEQQRLLRQAETAEVKFRELLEWAPDAIVTVDSDGRIVLVNGLAEQLFGYERAELLGQPVELLLPDQFRSVHAAHRSAYSAARRPRRMGSGLGLYGRRKDGSQFPIDVSLSPLQTADGLLVTSAIRDVSEARRAEAERQQLAREQAARAESESARQRLAFLAEASTLLASSLDYETILQRVVRLAVPFLADWCMVDVIEEGVLRCLAAAHADPIREALLLEWRQRCPLDPGSPDGPARVLQTGQSELAPEALQVWSRPEGCESWQTDLLEALMPRSSICVPIVGQGQTLAVLTLVAAASGRRYGLDDLALAEELARRCALAIDNAYLYSQLQQALRVRDEFLASAAHDLKTPLTGIKGYAQLLLRHASREDESSNMAWLVDGLGKIESAVTRMTSLLNELLDVARLQVGRPLDLDPAPKDLVALVLQVVIEHQQVTDRHQIRLEAPDEAVLGEWDAVHLERVVGNLLSNAIKYSPHGGEIRVAVMQEADEWAVVQVSDQGLGIPAAHLPHLFEWFQRAENVVGRVSGMGVGLAGARRIVEQHGGSITIESEEGVGTTVTVRLPLARAREAPDESAVVDVASVELHGMAGEANTR